LALGSIEVSLIPLKEAARENRLSTLSRTGELRSFQCNRLLKESNGRRLGCHTKVDAQNFPQSLELANRRLPVAHVEV